MFLLFVGENARPAGWGGGWYNFRGRWPTKEQAVAAAVDHEGDWWHVVDMSTLDDPRPKLVIDSIVANGTCKRRFGGR